MHSIKEWVLENKLVVICSSFGLLFLLLGVITMIGTSQKPEAGVLIEEAASTQSANKAESKPQKQITIDIEGAVVKPGVYTLPQDSRIQDALIAAGGVGVTADREYIEKNLNMAQKLADGAKLYISKVGETQLPPTATSQTTTVQGVSTTALVNINSASLSESDTLSGVGPVTAQKIIDNRPYNDLNELVSKKAVTKSVFEKIKEKITL